MVGRIRAGGGFVKVEGNCLNSLKGGGKEKRGGETKILKWVGVRLGQGVGVLKKRGAETPLQTMYVRTVQGKTLIFTL